MFRCCTICALITEWIHTLQIGNNSGIRLKVCVNTTHKTSMVRQMSNSVVNSDTIVFITNLNVVIRSYGAEKLCVNIFAVAWNRTCGSTIHVLHQSGIGFLYELLTHWGREKMAATSQTTIFNAFFWMKMIEFPLIFHWSLFPRVQLKRYQRWFR